MTRDEEKVKYQEDKEALTSLLAGEMNSKKREIVLKSREKTLEEDDLFEYLQPIMRDIAKASSRSFYYMDIKVKRFHYLHEEQYERKVSCFRRWQKRYERKVEQKLRVLSDVWNDF
jgi:preprotein translocase subunit SecA